MNNNPDYPFNLDVKEIYESISKKITPTNHTPEYEQSIIDVTQTIVDTNKIIKDFVEGKFSYFFEKKRLQIFETYRISDLFSFFQDDKSWKSFESEETPWNINFFIKNSFLRISDHSRKIYHNEKSNYALSFSLFYDEKSFFSIEFNKEETEILKIAKGILEKDMLNIHKQFSKEIQSSYDFMINIAMLISFYHNHNIDLSDIIKQDTVYSKKEVMKKISQNYEKMEMNHVLYDVDSTVIINKLKKFEHSLSKEQNEINKHE